MGNWLKQTALLFPLFCCFSIGQEIDSPRAGDLNKEHSGEQVRLSEILIATPKPYNPVQLTEAEGKAKQLLADIKNGSDFAKLAKSNSNGPSAALGGDVGYFTRDNLGQRLAQVVFLLKVGDVSDVIRTKQGFVILKVTAHMAAPHTAPNESFPKTLEILTNTMGVDFGPYLKDNVLPTVRKNWYALIPESASKKKGKVVIEFSILKNGSVSTEQVVGSSEDVGLDRPAFGAIVASNPFPPLPTEFSGPYIGLRFYFYYNSVPEPANSPPIGTITPGTGPHL